MTSIDRARFIRDLSARPIPARDLEASLSGSVTTDELVRLSGDDRIFNSPKELGALYDHLVSIENAQRANGATGDLDRARTVWEARRNLASDAPLAPFAPLTERPRVTGILASAPLPPMRDSEYVRALGSIRAAQLSSGGTRAEADSRQRILAETKNYEERLQGLEAQARLHRPGTEERARIERQIEANVRIFEGTLTNERGIVAQQLAAGSPPRDPNRALINAIPSAYLREVAERKGLVIPGVPGAVRPVFTAPIGIVWSGKL